MKGILFDARWIRPGMTGVGVAAFNLLASFAGQGVKAGIILNPGPVPPELMDGFRIFRTKADLAHHPVSELFEQIGVPFLCYRHGYDTFVSFEGRVPAWHFRIRTFSYIHDLSFLKSRGSHSLKYSLFLAWSLLTSRLFATRIIAVSHAVEKDLMEILKIPRKRILVIQNADSGLDRIGEREMADVPKPYFLGVGMNNPRKNLPCLLEGFRLFREHNPGYSLILTGNKAWIDSALTARSAENVVNLGFISAGELRFLYRNAKGLVYPSKDEGFGLPLMDAFRRDCPVFCSDIPVFREVMGGYARYFNPASPEDLAAKLSLGPIVPPGAIGLAEGYSWQTAASLLKAYAAGM